MSYLSTKKEDFEELIHSKEEELKKLRKSLENVNEKLAETPLIDHEYKYGPSDFYDMGQLYKKKIKTKKEIENLASYYWDAGLSHHGKDLFSELEDMEDCFFSWCYDLENDLLLKDPVDHNPNYIDFYGQ
jgi:dsDNA-specific endonuclease/ATPase MutS2